MTLGHQKWHGKSTLFHAIFKSGTEIYRPCCIGFAAPVSVQMISRESCFWGYKVYADILGGSLENRRQTTVVSC